MVPLGILLNQIQVTTGTPGAAFKRSHIQKILEDCETRFCHGNSTPNHSQKAIEETLIHEFFPSFISSVGRVAHAA
jgi:hypothetical protein